MLPTESRPAIIPPQRTPLKSRISMPISPKFIIVLLLIVIGVMLFLWKPWEPNIKADTRTIEVTGTATMKAEPDEYLFYPNYEFKNANKDAALAALTAKSDQIVAELKKLGVADSKIKSDSSGYSTGLLFPTESPDGTTAYTLNLTVTVGDKELAQKVQDYLVTTSPTGVVSPQTSFSTARQKQLESKARNEATKDARTKAEQSAKNLGFKLASVKSVNDGSGFGGPVPLYGGVDSAVQESASSPKLTLQPGENDLSYSITVTYFIK